jgi:hypothetical protein
MLQRDLHQQLRTESAATRERLASLLRSLDPAKLNEHPEPKGWSIGEVLEHLCIADELYERSFPTLMQRARPDAGAALREWKPSFVGKLIANALLGEAARKAPRVFRPRSSPRGGVVEEFLGRERRFMQELDDAVRYDWQALRIRSPALPRWAPKMNLGDALRIHVVHVTRHAKQVERLAGKVG